MKIAIIVPAGGGIKMQFLDALSKMLIWTNPGDCELGFFTGASSDLSKLRNRLGNLALEQSADWLLWLDADHTFPPDTLARLLAHNVAAVGINYPIRQYPITPVAVRKDGQRLETTQTSPPLEEVAWTGLGIFLVRADILRGLEAPLFSVTNTIGEDCYFCSKLGAAGHPIYVDSRLSLEVGHVHETVLTLGS